MTMLETRIGSYQISLVLYTRTIPVRTFSNSIAFDCKDFDLSN